MYKQAMGVWNGLLDLVYPPVCLVCGDFQDDTLCSVCIDAFVPTMPPYCDHCGAPAPAGHSVCQSCERGRAAVPYVWSHALGIYSGTLLHAIHRLKYDGRTALGAPLGKLLARSLDAVPSSMLTPPLLPTLDPAGTLTFDAVVPVPLHHVRYRQRGFNQAELLAKSLAAERGWKLDTEGLKRVRNTRTQTKLNADERAENVRDAFQTRSTTHYAGKSVLLVDDVLTTSATLSACALAVQNAGATRVCIAALARGS